MKDRILLFIGGFIQPLWVLEFCTTGGGQGLRALTRGGRRGPQEEQEEEETATLHLPSLGPSQLRRPKRQARWKQQTNKTRRGVTAPTALLRPGAPQELRSLCTWLASHVLLRQQVLPFDSPQLLPLSWTGHKAHSGRGDRGTASLPPAPFPGLGCPSTETKGLLTGCVASCSCDKREGSLPLRRRAPPASEDTQGSSWPRLAGWGLGLGRFPHNQRRACPHPSCPGLPLADGGTPETRGSHARGGRWWKHQKDGLLSQCSSHPRRDGGRDGPQRGSESSAPCGVSPSHARGRGRPSPRGGTHLGKSF